MSDGRDEFIGGTGGQEDAALREPFDGLTVVLPADHEIDLRDAVLPSVVLN